MAVTSLVGIPSLTTPSAVIQPDSASASELLIKAGAAAEEGGDPVLLPGQYMKVSTTSDQLISNVIRGAVCCDRIARWGSQDQTSTDLYIPADRSGEWVWVTNPTPKTLGADIIQTWGDAGEAATAHQENTDYLDLTDFETTWRFRDGVLITPDISGGPLSPRLGLVDEMPTDPAELVAWYRGQGTSDPFNSYTSDEDAIFAMMVQDLQWDLFPAAKRGDIWRAMATLPRIEVTDTTGTDGHTTIGLVNPGVTVNDAIDGPDASSRREITIDTTTGTLLSTRIYAPSPLTANGTALFPANLSTESSTYTSSIVDTAP